MRFCELTCWSAACYPFYRTKVIDANNQTTIYTYDMINRNTKINYGASLVTFEYDAVGNRTAMTDSLGVTRYTYDELNRPISITDALTGTVQYRYDDVGNRTKTIYPDGKIVTSTFDAANRLTQTLSWDGQVTQYAFDKAGRLMTTTLPNGVQSINTYDKAGRLVNLTHQGPYWLLATYTYTLDAVGNRLAVQERVLPPTPLVYLPMIRKDDGGEQMMVPPGQVSPFDSPLAVPAPFQSPLPTPTTTGSAGIPASPIADFTLLVITPTVLAALVGRRKKGRKWALPLALFAGTMMLAGLAQPASRALPLPMPFFSPPPRPPEQPGYVYPTAPEGTRVISYTYDGLYRLNAAAYSTGECYEYAYDRVGNRTGQTATITNTQVTTYQYDAADRLTSVDGQSYTWDDNGSLTNNGKLIFTYNNAGRMTQAAGITATQVYTYNGDGLLMSRNATRYVWDQAADLPQLLSDGSTFYVPGVGQWNGSTWAYELTDGLGSVRQLTDAQGNIIQRYDYSPFGEVVAAEGKRPSPLQYTGEQNDGDTGLIYLRARWYDPATGRFTTRDPYPGFVALPQTLHPYVYVNNNPVNLTDPSGKIAPIIIAIVLGMIIGGAGGGIIYAITHPCQDLWQSQGFWQTILVGAISGGMAGLVGWLAPLMLPSAGGFWSAAGVGVFTGSAAGGAGQATANLLVSKPWHQDVLQAMLLGGVVGGFAGGVGWKIKQITTAISTARITTELEQRAQQIHSVLDPIAQSKRTTAVLQTDIGRIVAGGVRDLTPAQRALLGSGEIAARLPGAHAEVTALQAARQLGAIPEAMAVTRTICPLCAAVIEATGGTITSLTTATWFGPR